MLWCWWSSDYDDYHYITINKWLQRHEDKHMTRGLWSWSLSQKIYDSDNHDWNDCDHYYEAYNARYEDSDPEFSQSARKYMNCKYMVCLYPTEIYTNTSTKTLLVHKQPLKLWRLLEGFISNDVKNEAS